MQTRDSTNRDRSEEGKRDLELENIVGNLLIAEYQVDRLRTRLSDIVNGYRPQMMKNNKWYKLALRIDETDVTPKDISEKKSDY